MSLVQFVIIVSIFPFFRALRHPVIEFGPFQCNSSSILWKTIQQVDAAADLYAVLPHRAAFIPSDSAMFTSTMCVAHVQMQSLELCEAATRAAISVLGAVDTRELVPGVADVTDGHVHPLRDAAVTNVLPDYRNAGAIDLALRTLELVAASSASFPPDIKVTYHHVGFSIENRTISALRIGPVHRVRPRIVFYSMHHAREWIAAEVGLRIPEYIVVSLRHNDSTRPLPGNERIIELCRRAELWFVPLLNPDGYEYSRSHDRMWRKNRRRNEDGTFGVDLNRNYPLYSTDSTWASLAGPQNEYRGTAPFSEPETSAWKAFAENVVGEEDAVLSYHSYGPVVLFAPGDTIIPAGSYRLGLGVSSKIASIMHQQLPGYENYIPMQASKFPSVIFGDSADWTHYRNGTQRLGITVELPGGTTSGYSGSFFTIGRDAIVPVAQENCRSAVWFAEYVAAHLHSRNGMNPRNELSIDWSMETFQPTIVSSPTYFLQSYAEFFNTQARKALSNTPTPSASVKPPFSTSTSTPRATFTPPNTLTPSSRDGRQAPDSPSNVAENSFFTPTPSTIKIKLPSSSVAHEYAVLYISLSIFVIGITVLTFYCGRVLMRLRDPDRASQPHLCNQGEVSCPSPSVPMENV